MAYQEYDRLTSAELQREVAEERRKLDRTITELQRKLDPSRIADNLLNSRVMGDVVNAATRGGADFAGNFGRTLAANPLPAALLGISLVWLMTGPRPVGNGADSHAHEPKYHTIDGDSLRRISHARDEAGEWYSEFADQAGKTYRARSNEAGHRIGDFIDSAGEAVGGFVDRSGRMVTRFTDEAGSLFDEAAGWARGAVGAVADAMSGMAETASKVGSGIAHTASRVGSGVADTAGHLGTSLQHGTDRAMRDAKRLIEEQPLVAGAIAFAAGAAIAAALPHTRQEDEALGDMSDEARSKAARAAGKLYEQGKEMASELYEETAEEVGELYEETKDKLKGERKAEEPAPDVRH